MGGIGSGRKRGPWPSERTRRRDGRLLHQKCEADIAELRILLHSDPDWLRELRNRKRRRHLYASFAWMASFVAGHKLGGRPPKARRCTKRLGTRLCWNWRADGTDRCRLHQRAVCQVNPVPIEPLTTHIHKTPRKIPLKKPRPEPMSKSAQKAARYRYTHPRQEPIKLTADHLCSLSGISFDILIDLQAVGLIRPNAHGLYRYNLVRWAERCHYLLQQGWTVEEIKRWTQERWSAPNPQEWPPRQTTHHFTEPDTF